jgi:hypothetical protein
MLSANDVQANRLINDLAAELTDPALAILHNAGVRGESVAMELGVWHSLTEGLEREHWLAGVGRDYSPEGAIEGVVQRAAVKVAAAFGYA